VSKNAHLLSQHTASEQAHSRIMKHIYLWPQNTIKKASQQTRLNNENNKIIIRRIFIVGELSLTTFCSVYQLILLYILIYSLSFYIFIFKNGLSVVEGLDFVSEVCDSYWEYVSKNIVKWKTWPLPSHWLAKLPNKPLSGSNGQVQWTNGQCYKIKYICFTKQKIHWHVVFEYYK